MSRPRSKWLRFHLSTAVLLMILIGVLGWRQHQLEAQWLEGNDEHHARLAELIEAIKAIDAQLPAFYGKWRLMGVRYWIEDGGFHGTFKFAGPTRGKRVTKDGRLTLIGPGSTINALGENPQDLYDLLTLLEKQNAFLLQAERHQDILMEACGRTYRFHDRHSGQNLFPNFI